MLIPYCLNFFDYLRRYEMKNPKQQIMDELEEAYSLLGDVIENLNRRESKNKDIDIADCNNDIETARDVFQKLDNMDLSSAKEVLREIILSLERLNVIVNTKTNEGDI